MILPIFLLINLALTNIKAEFFLPNNYRYCNSPFCSYGRSFLEHINCNNTHEIRCAIDKPLTPKGPYAGILYNLTSADKKLIVDYHNQVRNDIACGNVTTYPSASRMKKLVWDDQLEEAAILNVKLCDYGYDCHNTETYPISGQNIDLEFKIGEPFKNLIDVVMSTIKEWYREYINGNENLIQKYVESTDENVEYNHFTKMVTDRNTKIGCGVLQYKNVEYGEIWSNVYIVCNYDSTNIAGYSVYESGEIGSECSNNIDKTYECLCSD